MVAVDTRIWTKADIGKLIETEIRILRPPLWSSGQISWLQVQRSQARFLALPDFLRSSRSGTGSTQPREDN
jgi:hypothetical protein